MSEIWSFLVALIALPYLLVPVFIRRNQFFSLQPRLRLVLGDFLPETIARDFEEATTKLTALNFEHRIDAVSLDFGPNLRVFTRLFVETKKSIIATCNAILPDGKSEPIRSFIEFNSRYIDNFELSTHNSDLIGAPIEHRQKIVMTLPKIDDVTELLSIHERTITKLGLHSKTSYLPQPGLDLDFLIQCFQNDLSRQASLGSLMLDRKNNCYRLTWAGAFLMGWYAMWPLGPLMRLWQRIKSKIKMRAIQQSKA